MITHSQAFKSAETLFNYCNGRTCRMCIFAEKVLVTGKYECQFKHIIPKGMGEDYPTALQIAEENIDILRKKGRGE